GGLGEIGKNMTVYEFGSDIIVVDCGIGFPGNDMYGIDAVIPDITYLEENAKRIKGIFITHGHEDHIGALPYILKKINPPIYTCRFTGALISLKLEEHDLVKKTKIIEVSPGETVTAGVFSVEFIHINHSIPDAVAFAIKTPMGTVVHTGDFKIDVTPISGKMADLTRLGTLGNEGVLALLADSTNVEKAGHSESESSVGKRFDELIKDCDKRIIVTTFASNVHRIQQIINAAVKYRRKVGITGRSMENILRVSTELGVMNVPEGLIVPLEKLKNVPRNKQLIISTGSQGEEMSALYRMAFSSHKQILIDAGDRVIISASAIPGNEIMISKVIDELFLKGAEVVYDKDMNIHVSGHACREELRMVQALVRPKYFIPVHGEVRMLCRHGELAKRMGVLPSNVIIPSIGDVIEITDKGIQKSDTVPAGEVLVDGFGVGDVGSVVLRDRKHLADEGIVVVLVTVSSYDGELLSEPEIITRGFVYVRESDDLIEQLRRVATETVYQVQQKTDLRNYDAIKGKMKSNISGYLYRTTKRSPMIVTVVTEV
ncbi:MAG: ribonuclease J, partial [Oscillospiraceae bacterium]|nr:ribonuclease J [Oscillospiraceae bacterium]